MSVSQVTFDQKTLSLLESVAGSRRATMTFCFALSGPNVIKLFTVVSYDFSK
jgi:hypothetical protein